MSAFLVSHKHINTMVSFAERASRRGMFQFVCNDGEQLDFQTPEGCQAAAVMLLKQNMRSIEARYPDTIGHPDRMPGTVADAGKPITFRRQLIPDYPAILKACDCYDYQACETDDYYTTDAYRLTMALFRHAAREALNPQWEAAPWGID